MSQQDNQPAEMPTGIKLHKVSRYLEVSYASGESFNLPFEEKALTCPLNTCGHFLLLLKRKSAAR
jgi:DUF971 family protein